MAAVLLGSVFSTLFAGMLADWMGRKPLMILSGADLRRQHSRDRAFAGLRAAVFGRLLQGISGGLIGVVVPLTWPSACPPPSAAKARQSSSGC